MNWLAVKFGELMEFLKGPSRTSVYLGEAFDRTVTVTYDGDNFKFVITSRRVVYRSQFRWWWLPISKKAIFEVVGQLIEGDGTNLDPRLLEKVVFPNLCSERLLSTEYPHVRAIGAYLDRLREGSASAYQ